MHEHFKHVCSSKKLFEEVALKHIICYFQYLLLGTIKTLSATYMVIYIDMLKKITRNLNRKINIRNFHIF